jgi:hypothetical protein
MCAIEGGEENAVVVPTTFIVRAWRDAAGRLTGVVERVATGEKARFEEAAALAGLIQRMLGPVPPLRDMTDG